MEMLVQKYLPNDLYTISEIISILDTTFDELEKLYFSNNTKHLTEFKLKQRALHVFQGTNIF